MMISDDFPLISVILPVYNCEKFIQECLKSIINQSYQNIQIIIINDGSTDSSGDICNSYAHHDSRIILIHQANSGVSSARNKALEHASGVYVVFIDADDYIHKDYILTLYQNIKNYDIAICGYNRIEKTSTHPRVLNNIDSTIDHDDLFDFVMCNNYIGGYLWNKIFKTNIIQENNIKFDTSLTIGEDMLWIVTYLKYVNRGIYISECLYFYRLNTYSALQNSYTTKKFNPKIISNLNATRLMGSIITNESNKVHASMSYRYVRTSMWTIFNMLSCDYYNKKLLLHIQKYIRNNLKPYIAKKDSKLLEKLVACTFYINTNFFYKLYLIIYRILPDSILKKYLN